MGLRNSRLDGPLEWPVEQGRTVKKSSFRCRFGFAAEMSDVRFPLMPLEWMKSVVGLRFVR
jgi:hypothetical protein